MKTRKYVVDTNVLVSFLLVPNSISAAVVKYVLDNGKILTSDTTLDELSRVLLRDKFEKYVELKPRKLFIEGLRSISEHLEITKFVKMCRDPNDDKVLEVAINGKANFIITGDKDLLVLKNIEDIPIISPQEFNDKFII